MDDILSDENLELAWNRVSHRSQNAGSDGVTIGVFGRHWREEVERLRTEVLDSTYTPLPLIRFRTPRASGGERELHSAAVRDRVLQSAVVQRLDLQLDSRFPDASHGYRPGRSWRTALEAARHLISGGLTWTCCADIHSFFDSIDHPLLQAALEDTPIHPDVRHLLLAWVTGSIVDGAEVFQPSQGIAQGLIVAPLLSNLFLLPLDKALSASGIPYIRYADDLLLFSPTENEAHCRLSRLNELLAERRLQLSDGKCRIAPATRTRFMGQALVLPALARPEAARQPAAAIAGSTRTLYICRPGCVLRKQGRTLAVFSGEESLVHANPRRLRQIVVFGNAYLTLPALRSALRSDIPVYLVSATGEYWASIVPPEDGDLTKQRRQWAIEGDKRQLNVARQIVQAKLLNSATLLQWASGPEKPLRRIRALQHRSLKAATHGELMGIEGAGAVAYFNGLSGLLPSDFRFAKRSRRPPADAGNSMLSFAYSILHQNAVTALKLEGLDVRLGFLHQSRGNFAALACDLMEEFRAPVADRFVLEFAGAGEARASDFQCANGGCWMTPPLRRRFVQSFEARLWQLAPGTGRNWREQLQWQARSIADWLLERRKEYVPYRWTPSAGDSYLCSLSSATTLPMTEEETE